VKKYVYEIPEGVTLEILDPEALNVAIVKIARSIRGEIVVTWQRLPIKEENIESSAWVKCVSTTRTK
jgi:hypothetical protein